MSELAKREEEILKFWKENRIFEKSLQKPAPKGEFIFYDGPPFASGSPHYGHILAGTIKDAIPRYRTMQGYRVPRQWGWDCHGLPVENLVEKELGLKNKREIEQYGIEKFNEAARLHIMKDEAQWKEEIPRTGRWADMEHDYKTMDSSYTESVWWAFKSLYDRGLIYEGFKSLHYCPHCGTTLSNFEVAQGYKDIEGVAVTVKLPLVDEPNTSLLVWTTTPWTLPGNAAAAVNPNATYVKVSVGGEFFLLAKQRCQDVILTCEVVEELKGRELVGKKYKAPFDYYPAERKVYAADFVTLENGTGIVHIAPAFGADDLALAQKEKIPLIHHVTADGKLKEEVKDFVGLVAKPKGNPRETDEKVSAWLEAKGLLFKKDHITHSYPHCWRCDTPLLNWAADSWFVAVSKIKSKLLAQNSNIRWVPEHVGKGRFNNGLASAPDWAISRSRFWGAPLPVWRCTQCKTVKVVGSLAELKKEAGKVPDDLHRPYIDKVVFACACGGEARRVPEVFDCWFESGSMPFASKHYPFSKSGFDPARWWGFGAMGYPADFIAEGLDQTRGWFYSLIVLGTALFGRSPYKNVIVNGLVLASSGEKMSKRLKNYPDTMEVIGKHGADALRYYLLSSSVTRAEDLRFNERGVEEVSKKLLGRLDNVASFYQLYASPEKGSTLESGGLRSNLGEHPLDIWILSRLAELVKQTTGGYEQYELDVATRPLAQFIDDLSTWYVRRSRDRFKEGDKAALAVLRQVLYTTSQVVAPVMPFFAEDLYRRVREEGDAESVHLSHWPVAGATDAGLLKDMSRVRELASQGLKLREEAGIKVRQPLASFTANAKLSSELKDILQDELNVKEVKVGAELALDTMLTPELREEGLLREIVRSIQEWRKEQGLTIADRPEYTLAANAEEELVVQKYKKEILKAAGLKDLHVSKNNN